MRHNMTTIKVRLEVAEPGPHTKSSDDVWRFSKSLFNGLDAGEEHFVLLVLNKKNRINRFKVISTGTLTTHLVHPREVFSAVLSPRMAGGGDRFRPQSPVRSPAPSPEDQDIATVRSGRYATIEIGGRGDNETQSTNRFEAFSGRSQDHRPAKELVL